MLGESGVSHCKSDCILVSMHPLVKYYQANTIDAFMISVQCSASSPTAQLLP